jgi:hypothetical protein
VAEIVDADPSAISEEALQAIATNLYRNQRVQWILVAFNCVAILILLASISGVNVSVNILGAAIGSFLPIREMVLLIASLLGVFIFIVARQNELLAAVLDAQVRRLNPKSFFITGLRYRRFLIYPPPPNEFTGKYRVGAFRHSLASIVMASLIFGLLGFSILAASVHIIVLWQLWQRPEIPVFFNRLIISVVVLFDVMTTSGLAYTKLPLPTLRVERK